MKLILNRNWQKKKIGEDRLLTEQSSSDDDDDDHLLGMLTGLGKYEQCPSDDPNVDLRLDTEI